MSYFSFPPSSTLPKTLLVLAPLLAPGLNYHAEFGVHTVRTSLLVAMSYVLTLC